MNKLVIAAALGSLLAVGEVEAKEVFACDLKGLTAGERAHHRDLTKTLLDAILERVELPDGYGFRLERARFPAATEWTLLESKCCPFFKFQIELAQRQGALWLRLTGADGVKAFIREELSR